jgi:hypothetical protein
VEVDHSTMNRWVINYSPQLEEAFHHRKRPVWVSWRMDETSIRVKGEWRYLYRAVDKHGQTIDFLLTEHRDQEAALRVLKKAIRRHGVPEKITIDGSAANEAALKRYNEEHGTTLEIRYQDLRCHGDCDVVRLSWTRRAGGFVYRGRRGRATRLRPLRQPARNRVCRARRPVGHFELCGGGGPAFSLRCARQYRRECFLRSASTTGDRQNRNERGDDGSGLRPADDRMG